MAQAINENAQLAQLLASLGTTLFGGPKTTSTQTQTQSGGVKQTLVNPADILKLLSEDPNSGVAKTLSAGAGAGVYGRRRGIGSNALVLNDLLSRIGTQAAVAGAPTVTSPTTVSTTSTQQAAGVVGGGSSALLGTLGAAILASPSARAKGKEIFQDIFGGVKDVFGGASSNIIADQAPVTTTYDTGLPAASGSIEDVALGNTDAGIGVPAIGQALSSQPQDTQSTDIIAADATANLVTDPNFDSVPFNDGGGFTFDEYFGTADAATSGFGAGAAVADTVYDTGLPAAAGDAAFDGAIDATGGIPYVGIVKALSDGKVTSQEVGSLGGAYAGAQIGTAIFPGIGTAVGAVLGAVLGGSLGECFITTAILRTLGSKDDQHPILQVLRRYRDTWLKENHPKDIDTYYAIAPDIVAAIDERPDADQVWKNLYADYLVPAVHCIEHGDNAGAYEIYRNMVMVAKESAYG